MVMRIKLMVVVVMKAMFEVTMFVFFRMTNCYT
jgi:hypothetical protein